MDDLERRAVIGARLVGGVEPVENVRDDADEGAPRDWRLGLAGGSQDREERLAVHVVHDEKELAFGCDDVENGDDVRVLDARREPSLVEEHRDELGVACELRVQSLDRDGAREAGRAVETTEMNGRHAPVTNLSEQEVAADGTRRDLLVGSSHDTQRITTHGASIEEGSLRTFRPGASLSEPVQRAVPWENTAFPSARVRGARVRGALAEVFLTGGGTLVLFPLAWLLRRVVGLDDAELAAGFLTFWGAYVLNDPHFAVTYFLFYRDAKSRAFSPEVPLAQRVRWWISGVVVPLALVTWSGFAIARHAAPMLGAMIQLMYLLVGWHYVKQGFGVLTVLSARHGVRVSPRERRAFLAHCYAGWAYAWASPAVPAGEYEEKGVVYSALAHPRSLELATGAIFASSTIVLLVVLLLERRRLARSLPFAPVVGLLITVWLWTIWSSIDPVMRYLIPALHSLQYLYFVWLMRHGEGKAFEGAPTFGQPAAVRVGFLAASALVLGFVLFHGAPAVLDALVVGTPRRGQLPDDLGFTPFVAAFFVAVSIHHYFMDSVIWRRENPDTRFLAPPSFSEKHA